MFAERDFATHTCDVPIQKCKIIEVTEIFDGSYGNKKLVNGQGIDGTLYTFEVVPRKAISIIEPLSRRMVTGNQWKDKTDDKETEPYAETYRG